MTARACGGKTGSVIEHLEGDAFREFLDRDQRRVEAAVQRIGRVE